VRAEQNMATIQSDLEFIKEQTTIAEVNVARLFNFDVKRRRASKA
jgi:hypothetical protein